MIRFREAVRADVPAVIGLLREDALGSTREGTDPGPYLAAFDAMAVEPGNRLIVAEQAGEIIGCYQITVITGLSLSAARRAQIEGVRVAAHMRGQGIGATLMADAEARARAAGCRLIQLTTNSARRDAHRFYTRAGYVASHIGFKKPL